MNHRNQAARERAHASPSRRFNSSHWFTALALLPALFMAGAASAQSCAVGETGAAFGFTGGEQTTVVPAGVTSVTIFASGAQGGPGRSGAGTLGGSPNSPGGTGGLGGRVSGTLAVTPGATLSIWVGGQGTQAVNPGGIGQGTDGIGGGATDVRVGGNAIGNRVLVAGGGGGGGNAGWSTANVIPGGNGGVGGGGSGAVGGTVPGGAGPFGGAGGQTGIGGIGGAGCGGFPATAGNGANGDGGDSFNFSGSFPGAGFGGGGGGGAVVGGGGGGAGVGTTACQQNWNGGGGGGAGGGSTATGLTSTSLQAGVKAGNGEVLICFAPSSFTFSGTATGQSGATTLELVGTTPASTQQVVVANGATTFNFPTPLAAGSDWTVSVLTAPAGQTCSVTPSSGAALAANVTNLALVCQTVVVTVAPTTLPDATFNTAYSQTLSASSANGGNAPYTFTVTAGALPTGLTLSPAGLLSGTPTASGSFNFTVQATSSNGFSGARAYTVLVAQGAQAITGFSATPAAPVYAAGGTFSLSATGGASGNPVVFASTTPAVCTVAGSTVSIASAGSCALTADQAGNANFTAAPQVSLNVTIGQATQAITAFTATPAAPVFSAGGTFSVSATGGASGNPVLFASSTPGVCTVAGNAVTMVTAGNCTLSANQAGDANFTAAPQVQLSVTIGQATQAITGFSATPAAPVFSVGGTFSVSATGGASGNAVVFASTTTGVCTVAGNTVTMLTAGNCTLSANQAGNASYTAAPQVQLNVAIGQATQVITNFIATPGTPVYAPGGSFALSATGGASSSPVVFASNTPAVCTVSGNTATTVAAGVCLVTADQAADTSYSAAPQATLSVTVSQATQAITGFTATPAAPVYSPGGSFALSATGGASTSPVVFASTTPAVCTVSGNTATTVAAGTCSLTADQAADNNYSAAPQVTLDVSVTQATQAITGFTATPAAPVYSPGGSFAVSATAGASTSPVVFASTTPAVCTVSGNTANIVAAGNCSLTANQAGDANYTAAPQVTLNVAISAATPTLTWIGNLTRTMGQASFDLPNPSSPSAGAFTFSSTNGSVATVVGRTVTLVGDGVTTLVATQAANGSYLQGTSSITLTVSDRPDPTQDPSVVGGLQAQIDASVRFATAQQSNIRDRLRQQRHNPANSSNNGVSLSSVGAGGGSVAMGAGSTAAGQASMLPEGWGLWSAGVVTVGGRDNRAGSDGTDFLSDGITLGADWRVNERFLLGVAGGFGWDSTSLDDSRSDIDGDQQSLSLYGLWHNGEHLFVDGMLGWGQLGFDITRWSDVANAKAQASRDGDQAFGSLTLGYERLGAHSSLTGYGRFDASRTRLDAYRETGLGIYDLAYGDQTVDLQSLAVGLEGSYVFNSSSGQMRPYWMLEYRDALENSSDVALNYVVSPVAQDYRLGFRSYGDNVFTYGAGLDVDVTLGWRLSLLFRREHASNYGANTSLGLLLTYTPRATAATVATLDDNGQPIANAVPTTGSADR